MPGSSVAARLAALLLERWQAAAKAQRLERRRVLEPGLLARLRQGRKILSIPQRRGWHSPQGRL